MLVRLLITIAVSLFASTYCYTQNQALRMSVVDPLLKQVRIINLGRTTETINSYKLASGTNYVNLNSGSVTLIEGDFVLEPHTSVLVQWDAGASFGTTGGEMALYNNNVPNSPLGLLHFLAYGNYPTTFLEDYADPFKWVLGESVSGTGPYYYTSVGTSLGAYQWSNLPPIFLTIQTDRRYELESEMELSCSVALSEIYPMTYTGQGSIYEVTVPVKPNSSLVYAFNPLGNIYREPATDECHYEVPTSASSYYARAYNIGSSSITLPAYCYGFCEECDDSYDIQVTYNVDMNDQTVSEEGVFLFTSWDDLFTSPIEMVDLDGDGVYSHTATYPALGFYQSYYIFSNGDQVEDTDLLTGCVSQVGFGNFRSFFSMDLDAELPAVCFNSCGFCESNNDIVDVTFRVDAEEENFNTGYEIRLVSSNGLVNMYGDWEQMSDSNNDDVWELTLPMESGQTIYYRYEYLQPITLGSGDNPSSEEIYLPSECSVQNEFGFTYRSLTVPNQNATLPVVCYNQCTSCQGVEPTTVSVTFQVNMSDEDVSENGVSLVGAFQGWSPGETLMTDSNGDGIYTATVQVAPGSQLFYKFINGDTWQGVEVVPSTCGVDDGFGQFNRIINVGTTSAVVPEVCFGSCTNCTVAPAFVNVTLQVDMSNVLVSAQGVCVAGNFQGWTPGITFMQDDDGDNIYEYSFSTNASQELQFKFLNGVEWVNQENVPGECGIDNGLGSFNRSIVLGSNDFLYGPVCFSECAVCVPVVPETVNVTLLLDASDISLSPIGIHVAGNFQGWNPATSEMTDANDDGIFEIQFEVEANSTLLFKFINGNDWPDAESVPSECAVGDGFGGFNRILTIENNDLIYGPICFGQCAACPIEMYQLTWTVDMTNEIVSPEGVHIAGSFNNWSPNSTIMLPLGNGVYSASVEIAEETEVLYKFINGSSFAGVENVPSDCGVGDGFGGFNRIIFLDNQSLTLEEVCFSSCVDCVSSVNETSIEKLNVFPNPAELELNIQGAKDISQLEIINVQGQILNLEISGKGEYYSADISVLTPGIYLLKCRVTGQTERFVKQ